MLGLLPGAGGTQRLPKLSGVPTALDLALTGKNVPAKKAKSLGIVDQLIEPLGPGLATPQQRYILCEIIIRLKIECAVSIFHSCFRTSEYLEEIAVQMASQLASNTLKVNRETKGLVNKVMKTGLKFEFFRNFVFNKARQQVMKLSGGLYPAPLRVITLRLSISIVN